MAGSCCSFSAQTTKKEERRFNRFNIACNVFDRKPGFQKTDSISDSYGTVIIWCVILRVLADSAALLPCLGNYVAFLFMFALRT
jgi:hypothetical protein